ncbi:ABC transporter permease [Vaginisenegalia massiliensis]|uniref:ABC transporter permease n=1 Tax=Vaginisenegalia massiliensis TaxID=2058294 RepID=UPI0013DDFE10|nr:ABC transporter permease subunit [Vaginisenegalia massiliensis]
MKKYSYILLLLPFLIVVGLYELAPIVSIFVSSFKSADSVAFNFSLEHYHKAFTSKFYLLAIKNSGIIAVLSTILGLIGGLFGAFAIYSSQGELRKFFVNIVNMASNFQGVQLAFAFMIMLGNAGTFILLGEKMGFNFLKEFDLYSVTGIMLTFVYFQIPLAIILLYPAFDRVQSQYIEAAELMNCGGMKFWRHIGLPIILPNIFATVSVLFANAFAAYATPYALVGNNFALLPIRISTMFQGEAIPRPEFGSALSVIMLSAIAIVSMLATLATRLTNKGGLYE